MNNSATAQISSRSDLAEALLRTLQYFDSQEHPLTLVECSKYLLKISEQPSALFSLAEILGALENDLAGKVGQKHGFYFLAGREDLADMRLANTFYSSRRLKRARRFLPFARHLPFIRGLAVSGSEAMSSSKNGSDIDLLVISAKGRIWLSRISLSFYFQIFGLRRHGSLIENRFCLNHYIEQGKRLTYDLNLYTALLYVQLVPYFGTKYIYEFQQKNLDWITEFLQQPQIFQYSLPQPEKASALASFVEALLANPLGDWLERLAGKYQKSRIRLEEFVTVEDTELSFHPDSKGQKILKKAGINNS